MSLLKPGVTSAEVTHAITAFPDDRGLLRWRSFGHGHSLGLMAQCHGRKAGLEPREDIDAVLEPRLVISMQPMPTIPQGQPGAGG